MNNLSNTQGAYTLPTHLEGIIFDCDGVILDSRVANEHYYNCILQECGLPKLTKEQEAYTYMATVRQSLEYIIPKHIRPHLATICKKAVNYQKDIMPLIRLERGLIEFLQLLHANNIRMAVHTNRFNGMPAILDTFNLHSFFDTVVTAAMVTPKPSPEGITYICAQWECHPQNLLFIGDSLNDEHAAKAAGVAFVAYRNTALNALLHVDSFDELHHTHLHAYVQHVSPVAQNAST